MPKPNRLSLLLMLVGLLFSLQLSAQLTIKVNAIPANTPAGANIYIVGTFNNWNPGDATKIMTSLGNGQYSITLNGLSAGQIKFKFTRGSWASVEGDANYGEIPDRVFNYAGGVGQTTVSIMTWKDLNGGSNPGSTAAPNVQILDNAFQIPQLNRTRRIWLYLPPDYNSSNKFYPVLYMQDGQNLFDATTSFSGEWEVDESLNELFQQGDYGCIVVGIDNGGDHRIDEYSPWVNTQYGGGEGDEYLDFMVSTLKPYIDTHFRTLPGRNTTGIMGSSVGAVISMYGLAERQDVFSKAGIFSSAFWLNDNSSADHVASHTKQGDVKVYFLAGGQEPAYVTTDMENVADAMDSAGFGPEEKLVTVKSDGEHSEWFWAREFPAAYIWLFGDAVTSTKNLGTISHDIEIYPNPAGDWLRVSDVVANEKLRVQIIGADGKLWRDNSITSNTNINTSGLPEGFYSVKIKRKNKDQTSKKLLIRRN